MNKSSDSEFHFGDKVTVMIRTLDKNEKAIFVSYNYNNIYGDPYYAKVLIKDYHFLTTIPVSDIKEGWTN